MKKKPVDKIVFDSSSLCNSHKDAVSRNFEVMEKKNLEKIEKKNFFSRFLLLFVKFSKKIKSNKI